MERDGTTMYSCGFANKDSDINSGMPDEKGEDLVLFAKAITPNAGGIEAYSDCVAQAWHELGFRVTVITQFDAPAATDQRGAVTVINVGPGSQLGVFWRMLKAARRLRKTLQPRLVHATTWRVAIPALLAFRSTPVGVTVHGREITETTGLLKQLMRLVINRIDTVLVISQSTLDQCLPVLPVLADKSVVSWNGLTYVSEAEASGKQWSTDPGKPLRVYSLCRLAPRKNISGSLEALARVRANGIENWEYFIAGDGEERQRLERMNEELGLGDKVTFLGRVGDDDIARLYLEADVFLHPQTAGPDGRDIEGFGLVLVDGMAFGTPVIAGIDGAPKEYIKDGETAFLVDGNDVAAMAELLGRLLGNPEELKTVGQAGREWALSTLTWKGHVERLWTAMNRATIR